MPLVLRNQKGSKLTYGELDGNFTYLDDKIESIVTDPQDVVKTVPQELTGPEKNNARANIEAVDVRLNDLVPNLTPQEKDQIRSKIGVMDPDLTGYVVNPSFNSETYTLILPVVNSDDLIIHFPVDFVSYEIVQNLSELQQSRARNNIDAVGNSEMQQTIVPDWSSQLQSLINF